VTGHLTNTAVTVRSAVIRTRQVWLVPVQAPVQWSNRETPAPSAFGVSRSVSVSG
jgi:hypothetical protein